MKRINFRLRIYRLSFLFLFIITNGIAMSTNYQLTFSGNGSATIIDSVIIQNLTKNTIDTILNGSNIILSNVTNSLNATNDDDQRIQIYQTSGQFILKYSTTINSTAEVSIYNLNGEKIVSLSHSVSIGENIFSLLVPRNSSIIKVKDGNYCQSIKIINNDINHSAPSIKYNHLQKNSSKIVQQKNEAIAETKTIQYTDGDRLLFIGISGTYKTLIVDSPASNKNINFEFVRCTDGDGNNYKVVRIGTQIWMAENLRTTKLNDGTPIQNLSSQSAGSSSNSPAYCWYNNDNVSAKINLGGLYNGFAAANTKIAPTGWHVASNDEWNTLQNYLIANGYNSNGSTTGNNIAKSISSTTGWNYTSMSNCPGNQPLLNNKTGFSAKAGGSRNVDGEFIDICETGYWWTSDYWTKNIYSFTNYIVTTSRTEGNCFSIRCIKD